MHIKAILPRLLICVVLFFNIQCAILFLLSPDAYAPGFEVTGAAGRAMVQGMGILFLMWNVPYVAALLDPIMNKRSLVEAVIMQTIGVIGESALFAQMRTGEILLRSTAMRFIVFDAGGLVLLLTAAGLVYLWHGKGDRV